MAFKKNSPGTPKAENRVEVNKALKITVLVGLSVYTFIELLFMLNACFHWLPIPPK